MTLRPWLTVVAVAFALVGCGGGGDDGGGSAGGADDTGSAADDVLGSVADAVGDALADTEDAPGAARFVNLMQLDGAPIDVDVWWGLPDDGNKAVSLKYGEASDYLTPQQSEAFGEVSWSVSAAGAREQLIGQT